MGNDYKTNEAGHDYLKKEMGMVINGNRKSLRVMGNPRRWRGGAWIITFIKWQMIILNRKYEMSIENGNGNGYLNDSLNNEKGMKLGMTI